MPPKELTALHKKVDELIQLCRQLDEENRALKSREAAWVTERGHLVEKNELARTKVEAMISRLKSLEQGQ